MVWVAQEESMYINLRCPACKESVPTSYNQLYAVWKEGYDKMSEELKEEAYLTAEIRCLCGHKEKYSSPMFKYLFGIMFHEMKSLEN
jgi:hypothetical protein